MTWPVARRNARPGLIRTAVYSSTRPPVQPLLLSLSLSRSSRSPLKNSTRQPTLPRIPRSLLLLFLRRAGPAIPSHHRTASPPPLLLALRNFSFSFFFPHHPGSFKGTTYLLPIVHTLCSSLLVVDFAGTIFSVFLPWGAWISVLFQQLRGCRPSPGRFGGGIWCSS